MMDTYTDFLKAKIRMASLAGVDCDTGEINPLLKPHQRDIVQWAVRGGQRAIFAQFGLGKTFMQLEICRILQGKTGDRSLIVCPLGVRQEFFRDADKLGLSLQFVRRADEMDGEHVHRGMLCASPETHIRRICHQFISTPKKTS